MNKIDKINELLDKSLRNITNSLDDELYLPIKFELQQKNVTHSLGFRKEFFKEKIELEFKILKKEIVKIIVDTSINQ